MAEAARRAIADRRRPLLSPAAAQVDARLRAYASTAVARLELAAGALTAGWALNGGPATSPPWLAVVAPVVGRRAPRAGAGPAPPRTAATASGVRRAAGRTVAAPRPCAALSTAARGVLVIVQVDPASPVPVFEQLRSQIERLIASGQLAVGTTLPPIRHLATDLGLARGTVNKVYDALARDGLVETAGRHGTIVRRRASSALTGSDLDAAADTLALVARQLGLPPDDARRALDAAMRRLRADNPVTPDAR